MSDVKRALLEILNDEGLKRSGRRMMFETSDLLWLVEPDTSPRENRLGVDVGCVLKSLAPDHVTKGASDCHVYVAMENLPLTASLHRLDDDRSLCDALLKHRTDINDDERIAGLKAILAPLARLVVATRTTSELRDQYRAGVFKSAFINRDALTLLQG